MPTPSKGYFLKDGSRVPGASTIAGYYKPEPAVGRLLGWARKEALAGRDHKETLATAADIGTAVHAMIESKIKGLPVICSLDDLDAVAAWAAFGEYEKWAAKIPLEVIAQEVQLVSEIYKFGGTPDLIGRSTGGVKLFDWKTSNGIYESHGLQVAAYVVLWNENNPDNKITDGAHIARFSKTGEFGHCFLEMNDLAILWAQFHDCLVMWRRQKTVNEIMERSLGGERAYS